MSQLIMELQGDKKKSTYRLQVHRHSYRIYRNPRNGVSVVNLLDENQSFYSLFRTTWPEGLSTIHRFMDNWSSRFRDLLENDEAIPNAFACNLGIFGRLMQFQMEQYSSYMPELLLKQGLKAWQMDCQ